MVTEQLKYQILKDAEQQDLLPTALINKYDVSLGWLMEILKSLLNDGLLALTEGKWLRITEKGKLSIAEEEDVPEDDRKTSYIEEFFTRSVTIGVNEPYLPSSITCMKIMEGARQKETSNKK
jgi:predicted transcriptional regulator